MNFKQFILENEEAEAALKKWEDLLHHIAEEELVSCKVNEIVFLTKGRETVLNFIADCNDDPRKEGYQADLSKKLTERLKKHNIKGLSPIKAKVYHKNIDPR